MLPTATASPRTVRAVRIRPAGEVLQDEGDEVHRSVAAGSRRLEPSLQVPAHGVGEAGGVLEHRQVLGRRDDLGRAARQMLF